MILNNVSTVNNQQARILSVEGVPSEGGNIVRAAAYVIAPCALVPSGSHTPGEKIGDGVLVRPVRDKYLIEELPPLEKCRVCGHQCNIINPASKVVS